MSDKSEPQESADFRIEQHFLEELEAPVLRFDELAKMLLGLHNGGQFQRRDDCYLILQKKLETDSDFAMLLKLVKLRASWLGNSIAYGQECRDVLLSGTNDRLLSAMVECAGFGQIKPLDSIRKIESLMALSPGKGCLDATWGFGVVRKIDDFYKKVVVDFDRKPGHTMSFSYASDALKPVSPDHVLAVRHADPAKFEKMCEEEPGKIVRMTLASFGAMPVTRLETVMTGGILPKDVDWRSFWSRARAQLKNCGDIKIPPVSQKNTPVSFIESAGSIGDQAWFVSLAGLTDVQELLSRLSEFKRTADLSALSDEERDVLRDRFGFILKACATTHDNKEKVRAILLALDFGFESIDVKLRKRHEGEFVFRDPDGDSADAESSEVLLVETLRLPDIALDVGTKLSPTLLDAVISKIPFEDPERLDPLFIDKIPEMSYALIERILPKLLSGSGRDSAVAVLQRELSNSAVPYPLLFWVCKNQNREDVRALVPASVVVVSALLSLEPQVSGEDLRLQRQIAKCFTDDAWLFDIFDRIDDYERRSCFDRIKSIDGEWTPQAKRTMISHIRSKYPDLFDVGFVPSVPPEGKSLPRVTSWRSYNERKEKYRILVEKEIPQNSRDIDTARMYGDLRENFEYQTAKDNQRVLLRTQAELAADLNAVTPTDFSEFEFDGKAGIATSVTIRYPSGAENTYHILGEWDSDPDSGIIPSLSRLAAALCGHTDGDEVEIPDEHGSAINVTLKSVTPVSDEIRAWAEAEKSSLD